MKEKTPKEKITKEQIDETIWPIASVANSLFGNRPIIKKIAGRSLLYQLGKLNGQINCLFSEIQTLKTKLEKEKTK